MRCVLDTDVLVAAVRSPKGASRQLIQMVARRELIAVATVAMMAEYEAVLKRPMHLQAANLTSEEIDILLDTLAMFFVPVTPHFIWRPLLRDPDDEMILEAAVNGQAKLIITFNTRHFSRASHRFGITALKPSEALRRLKR
jgi:putative PIN family toxin of toxin-antitoxin system